MIGDWIAIFVAAGAIQINDGSPAMVATVLAVFAVQLAVFYWRGRKFVRADRGSDTHWCEVYATLSTSQQEVIGRADAALRARGLRVHWSTEADGQDKDSTASAARHGKVVEIFVSRKALAGPTDALGATLAHEAHHTTWRMLMVRHVVRLLVVGGACLAGVTPSISTALAVAGAASFGTLVLHWSQEMFCDRAAAAAYGADVELAFWRASWDADLADLRDRPRFDRAFILTFWPLVGVPTPVRLWHAQYLARKAANI